MAELVCDPALRPLLSSGAPRFWTYTADLAAASGLVVAPTDADHLLAESKNCSPRPAPDDEARLLIVLRATLPARTIPENRDPTAAIRQDALDAATRRLAQTLAPDWRVVGVLAPPSDGTASPAQLSALAETIAFCLGNGALTGQTLAIEAAARP